jgi:hypothetical protein
LVSIPAREKEEEVLPKKEKKPEWHFKPGPISMEKMKTRGCVADGLISGYGSSTGRTVKMINRSECYYLHRALETWADTPDFEKAEEIMEEIKREPLVYGMFIAEALRTDNNYEFTDEDRDFRFSKMCQEGTDGRWGDNTCIPDLEKREYQKYVKYIMRQAMDIGIQSFLFGQIYLQESEALSQSAMPEIITAAKKYAKKKGMEIVIGAQTNAIMDQKYLKNFDYIEGGVGINSAGNIENGPCWSGKSSCWALLWHPDFSAKAKNVFLHLDWSGLVYDDMSKFVRMDQDLRIKTLNNLYDYFTRKNMGFMMPFLAVISKDAGGCRGPEKDFYSPDNQFSCKDEDGINAILKGK